MFHARVSYLFYLLFILKELYELAKMYDDVKSTVS